MSLFLKLFETTAEYNAYTADTSNFILPNVSCTLDDLTNVHYNPYVDPYAGHDYVEIGGLKWATMNVGANSITDAGLYFQWGDISGYTASQVGSKKYFGWGDYKYATNVQPLGEADMTKYNSTDGKTVLEASDDAATANWGGQWRMPTLEEYTALSNAVNTAWTADYQGSGVAGLVCTDKTDSSKVLFFPACGVCGDGTVFDEGTTSAYWSSSIYSSDILNAYVHFNNGNVDLIDSSRRRNGFPVRGVVG